jgi:hypothetical protein
VSKNEINEKKRNTAGNKISKVNRKLDDSNAVNDVISDRQPANQTENPHTSKMKA